MKTRDMYLVAQVFARADRAHRNRAIEAANIGVAVMEEDDVTVQAARVFFMLGLRANSDYGASVERFAEALKPVMPGEEEAAARAGAGAMTDDERRIARACGISDATYTASRADLGLPAPDGAR